MGWARLGWGEMGWNGVVRGGKGGDWVRYGGMGWDVKTKSWSVLKLVQGVDFKTAILCLDTINLKWAILRQRY